MARAILIAGPTASGKSGLALRLAEHVGGVVINADSMQVYRELRVLTARPSPEEEARAPHALYGFVAARDNYSAGRFAADAARAIADAERAGLRPIIVGGTGLYLKTLLEGLSPMPPVAEDIRTHWRTEAAKAEPGELHRILMKRDPEMGERLASSDTQRIVRALEVLEATGQSLRVWQQLPREPVLDERETIRILLAPERAELYRRIDQRFASMIEAGALEEARQLEAEALPPTLPIMGTLGLRPLWRHLGGEIDQDEAVTLAQTETRQYAKRQLTWIRRNMITWHAISEKETERQLASAITFIDQ